MPKISLSDIGLRSLAPPQSGTIDYWDATFPAFGVRVSQGGTKTFVLNIRKTRQAIGRYPIVSLADARAEAKRILAEKTLGKHRRPSLSFQQARDRFLAEKQRTRRPLTYEDHKDRLARHFRLKGPLSEIAYEEIVRRLAKIKTGPEHNQALRVVKTFFTWAMNARYITENPTTGISMREVSSRSRVLSDDELKAIWVCCASDGNDLPDHFRTIVRLLILLGQRRGETAAFKVGYFSHNEQTITLPATLTKNKREHVFPVGELASDILRPLTASRKPDEFLFPARGTNDERPFNGWSKSKTELDALCGVQHWTLHDLRRTYRTTHAKLGTPPYIAERIINHISHQSEVERIYDRWTYMPAMREAVARYEQHLRGVIQSAA